MEVVFYISALLLLLFSLDAITGVLNSIKQSRLRAQRFRIEADDLKNQLLQQEKKYSVSGNLKWKGYRRFRVSNRVMEAQDICSFYLSPLDEEAICPYEPGQHLGFKFQIPGEAKHLIRTYSLSSGDTASNNYRVTIKKVPPPPGTSHPPGRGSTYFHEDLEIGSTIEVSAPAGKFYLDRQDQRPAVFIAGGIGVTPLLSMLEVICDKKIDRVCHFFHAVRNSDDHAFAQSLKNLAEGNPNVSLHTYYSSPQENAELASGIKTGFLSVDAIKDAIGHSEAQFYICGPPPMMEALVPSLEEAGVNSADILMEAFGPASVKKKKNSESDGQEKDAKLESSKFGSVHFVKSDVTVEWDGSSSILDMAEEHDVDLESSCRAGSCGTCQVKVVSGKIIYEDEPSTDPDEGNCLTCVGTPEGDVKIDA
ncbi:MAG: 2Fe-2S iron-sulfur cluster binding domain-containing protein [Planctomycetia bacterium]|nr:2Fe-2S iron-sulfur cluster binding domain-containing protein [Planctomycetia bacterium]NCG00067.1 2Fe-2S iron-sulfur cluster binding domain-containing protein [Planctomycetia bacterium]NCG12363.1 2Fe-2S iron-sulfur cluster binding domain-containing protein [Planctomycetia bacterium]NCG55294.1 2Fe-2S iron-sulfur cluster binding domain-containing protein [Pseudomonadota bacterium]